MAFTGKPDETSVSREAKRYLLSCSINKNQGECQMRVLVTGAKNPSEVAEKSARQIGEDLVKNGFILLTGGMQGIDAAAAKSAHEFCLNANLNPTEKIISYVTGSKGPGHNYGDLRRSKYKYRSQGVPNPTIRLETWNIHEASINTGVVRWPSTLWGRLWIERPNRTAKRR